MYPRFRVIAGRVVRGVLQLPLRAVVNTPLPQGLIPAFSRVMTGIDTPVAQLAPAMQRLQVEQPAEYVRRYSQAIVPIMASATDLQRARFGATVENWPVEAFRQVYTTNDEPTGGGHGTATVSFAPLENAVDRSHSRQLMRQIFGSFPGGFASISDAHYAQLVARGRELDGTPEDVLQRLRGEIVDRNTKLFLTNADIAGINMIGSDSFVRAHGHDNLVLPDGTRGQTVLMATSHIHRLSGLLPWTALAQPSLPNILTGLQMHVGQAWLPGVDEANSAIAPGLGRVIYSSAAALAELYPHLVAQHGEQIAAGLLLHPENLAAFHDRLWNGDGRSGDWNVICNRAIFVCADTALGGPAGWAKIFRPDLDPTAIISAQAYLDAQTRDGMEKLVEMGKTPGDFGPGGMVAKPGELAPDGEAALAGDVVPDPEGGAFNRTAPLDPIFATLAAPLDAERADLPWDYVRSEVDHALTRASEQMLATLGDPLQQSVETLTALINTPEQQSAMLSTMNQLLNEALVDTPGYAALSANEGEFGAGALVTLSVTLPTYEAAVAEEGGASWMSSVISRAVIDAQARALQARASDLQRQAADLGERTGSTRAEVAARRETLREVEEALEKTPADPDLEARRDALERALKDLAERESAELREKTEIEEQAARNERAGEEASEARHAADRDISERGREVFHGE